MGTPVWRCAWAVARRIRSTPGVRPGASVAHFRMPALTCGVGDALLDIADEHVGDELGSAEDGAGAAIGEVVREVAIGVDAGGDDDVQAGLVRDPLDAGDVAAETEHGEIDDRVDAARFQLVHAGDGVGDALAPRRPSLRGNFLKISESSTKTCSCMSVVPRPRSRRVRGRFGRWPSADYIPTY